MEQMGMPNGIQYVDEQCETMYRTGQGTSTLNLGAGQQVLGTLEWILSKTNNPYTQLFALARLRQTLMVQWTALPAESVEAFCNFLLAMLEGVQANAKIAHDVAALLALIAKKQYIMSSDISYTKSGDKINKEFVKVKKLLEAPPTAVNAMYLRETIVALTNCDAVTDENGTIFLNPGESMSAFYRFHNTMIKDVNAKAAENFHATGLREWFAVLRVGIAFNMDGERATENESNHTDTHSGELFRNAQIYEDVGALFSKTRDPDVLDFLCDACSGLTCGGSDSTFQHMMHFLARILSAPDALSDSGVHHQTCRLVYSIFHYCGSACVSNAGDFAHMYPQIRDFTVQTFKACKWAPHAVRYLIGAWKCIVAMDGISVDALAYDVLATYIHIRFENVAGDDELFFDYIFHDELLSFANLVRSNYSKFSVLLRSVQPTTPAHYQWTMAFFCAVLNSTVVNEKAADSEIDFALLSHAFGMMNAVPEPLLQSVEVSLTLLMLLAMFRHAFVERTKLDWSPFKAFFPTRDDARLFLLEKALFFMERSVADHRILAAAVDLLLYGEDYRSPVLISVDNAAVTKLLSLHAALFREDAFSPKMKKTRIRFNQCIVELVSAKPAFLAIFFTGFERRLASNPTRNQLYGLLLDIRGVMGVRNSNVCKLLYDFFVINHSGLLQALLLQFPNDVELVSQVAKVLTAFLSLNSGCIQGSKRSVFALHSMVSNTLIVWHELLYDPEGGRRGGGLRHLLLMVRLWNKLMNEEVLNADRLEALKIYQPKKLDSLLDISADFIFRVKTENVFRYPKLCEAFFKAISRYVALNPQFHTSTMSIRPDVFMDVLLQGATRANDVSSHDCTVSITKIMSRLLKRAPLERDVSELALIPACQRALLQRFLAKIPNGYQLLDCKGLYVTLQLDRSNAVALFEEMCTKTTTPSTNPKCRETQRLWFVDLLKHADAGYSFRELRENMIIEEHGNGSTVFAVYHFKKYLELGAALASVVGKP